MPHDEVEADQLAPSHLDGLTIAQLSERLRCAECGGQLQSVKPWRMEDVIGMWGTQDDGPPRRMSPCSEIIGFGSSVGFNLGYCAMHPKQDMGQQIGDRIFRLAVTKAPHGSAWNENDCLVVRFGSLADVSNPHRDVRYVPLADVEAVAR